MKNYLRPRRRFVVLHSRPQYLRVWECTRKLWETLRRNSQNLVIWASQRMLFDRTKTFCFFYILNSSAYGFRNVCVSSGKLCAGVATIWLFGPHSACSLIEPKLFASFYLLHRESLVLLGYYNWRNSVNGPEEFSGIQGSCGSCWENTVKRSQSQIWDLHNRPSPDFKY